MNSTGRPRIPFALTSLANSSAARRAWMPYWALLPDRAAGIPILIGPCAHARRRWVGRPGLVPMPPATAPPAIEILRKSRRLMIGLLACGPDYSRGVAASEGREAIWPGHLPWCANRRQEQSPCVQAG